MDLRRFIPFASVALLVAVARPANVAAVAATAIALVATLPWSIVAGWARRRRDREWSEMSDVDAAFQRGWEHLQYEEFVAAERAFRSVLDARPDDADATLYLGRALAEQGRHAEAVERLRIATTVRPLDAEAQAWLGKSLAAMGEVFLAATALREALRLRPGLRVAEQMLEQLLGAPNALGEERTVPGHARFPQPVGRRRANRYIRRTTPESSLELQAGA
jgi:tetratricopeptide (TPR) repeat protein